MRWLVRASVLIAVTRSVPTCSAGPAEDGRQKATAASPPTAFFMPTLFNTRKELEASPWGEYVRRIYGDDVHALVDYPFETGMFWVFNRTLLLELNISFPIGTMDCNKYWKFGLENHVFDQALRPRDQQGYSTGPAFAESEESIMADHVNMARALRIGLFNPGWMVGNLLFTHHGARLPVRSHHRIEVTHCQWLPINRTVPSKWEEKAYWMYAMPGSGVYYNVGNTAAFQSHEEFLLKFLRPNQVRYADPNGRMQDIGFRFASENAKLAGLKSVQILRRWDQPCDARGANQWLEILDLHNTGLQTCINGLRQGFGGVRRCNCDPHRLCARCLEHAQVQHRNRSTHGEHTRRATSSHKLPDAQTYKL